MNIKRLREAKQMSQFSLAEKLEISQQAVSNWETGERMPRTDMLPKLAAVLSCTIDELLASEEK